MKKTDYAKHFLDAIIFLMCYVISLAVNLFLGFGQISFGSLVVYSMIFGLLEVIKILFFNWRERIIFFFVNIYLAYCLTSFYFIVKSKAVFVLKSIITIKIDEYILLLGISLLFSFIGYLFLIIHYHRLKRKD